MKSNKRIDYFLYFDICYKYYKHLENGSLKKGGQLVSFRAIEHSLSPAEVMKSSVFALILQLRSSNTNNNALFFMSFIIKDM